MKRTWKRLTMLMTVLFLLIMGSGATIAWGSVTVPTKGTMYSYDSSTKKWTKTGNSFTASYSSSGKLKKVTYKYGSEKNTYTYTWKGDYLKKTKYSYTGDKPRTTTYTYKNRKLSKVKGSGFKTTYKWKGSKGTATQTYDGGKNIFKLTLKNGRLAKETMKGGSFSYTYSYYQRGLRKSYKYKDKDYTHKVTYGKNGFPKKSSYDSTTVTYKWKKKEVTITQKEKGKVVSKYKWKFSKTKRVNRAWNCDAYGLSVSLSF